MTNCKHEVRRPTDYNDKNAVPDWNDGTIHGWNGGDCPVHPETVVQVWFRVGGQSERPSGIYCWSCSGGNGDIIAFRVVKPYVEPKVIWVNEYPSGDYFGHDSEEKAKHSAKGLSSRVIRIAVKYVEAIADAKECKE